MKQKIVHRFAHYMSRLKSNKKALYALIAVDLIMAVTSNIVDLPWLMSVEWYLMPFAPICALYPLTLAIWFTLYLTKKKIPNWFTTFIFIGIISYGPMAYIYYPAYMAEFGMHWRLFGNMIWVTAYALQAFIIADQLKPLKIVQYLPIFTYFFFKDYSDRYLGSFIDLTRNGFPENLKNQLFAVMLIIHAGAITAALSVAYKNMKKTKPLTEQVQERHNLPSLQ